MCGEGRGKMPAKVYLAVEHGDFRAMPASLPGCAGVKWVNVHPQNPSRGLPSVMAVLIYSDPETGYPLAIMDATEIFGATKCAYHRDYRRGLSSTHADTSSRRTA
jgi:ornithine cyclodeaminase/alanine dehydrogenase-like protein (mu-crystallin family)